MSKNIVIQEGGIGKQMTVDKLKTNLLSGGTCLWVPEDETRLGTKYISENGTYKASDEGLYGYSEVTVSGIGTATGTGPDGEQHKYTEDGEGGITDTLLPSSISVVTPPTVTTYADGATINFSGMVVKAYLKSGGVWTDALHPDGIIPISELTLPVTKADAQETDGWTDGQGLNAKQITYMPVAAIDHYGHEGTAYVGPVLGARNGNPSSYGSFDSPGTMLATRYDGHNYGLWKSGTIDHNLFTKEQVGDHGVFWHLTGGTSGFTRQDRFEEIAFSEYLTDLPSSTEDPRNVNPSALHATTQTIPVQWSTGGTVLESSFEITVT